MGRMPLPTMDEVAPAAWSGELRRFLERRSLHEVHVNAGLPVPEHDDDHGGITRVPFLMLFVSGVTDARIRDGGRVRTVRLHAGSALLHAPGSYAKLHHRRTGTHLRVTADVDHVLCGSALCRDPRRLDDPHGFPPLRGCVLPRPLPDPALGLLRLVLASPPEAQAQRRSWVAASCWQLHEELQGQAPPGAAARWLAMRDWLAEHAALPVGRDDCARAFGVHPNHVARLFRQHGATSFTECLLRLRLERAQLLLRDGDRPIAEVARRCGFGDSAYFVRRFRERMGLPPDRWRRCR